MFFLLLGLLFIALKYLEVGLFAGVSWLWLLLPLGLAFMYWEVLDPFFHISKKREMRKMEERKAARVQKLKEANHPHLRKSGRK